MRREIISEINYYRERNMKPNFTKLGREYGIDPRTVKKYYENPNPVRKAREWHSSLDRFEETIRQKAAIPGMTFAAVYHYLRNELGLDKKVAYSTLTAYCRRKEITLGGRATPHVRFETDPGHQVQVDWKEDLKLRTKDGGEIEFNVYTATLGFSRKHIFIFSKGKTEQDFISCTNKMLAAIGGSVREILTDNMSAIVSISGGDGPGRRKHQNVLQWEGDAGIRIRLCKPRSPETKGKDESANRFINWLLPYDGEVACEADVIKALAKVQNEANDKVNPEIGMAPESLFRLKERPALGPLPNMSLLGSYADGGVTRKVQETLLVPFLGRQYSAPAAYIGKNVRVLRNGDTVEIYYNKKLIASHPFDESKAINYDKTHYIEGLAAATGAKGPDLEKIAEANLRRMGS